MRFNFILLMLSILFIVSTASAYTEQHQLLRYQFEEGTGSIILDSSGNGYHAIRNGANWNNNEAFGIKSLNFDGDNDFVNVLTSDHVPNWMFISFWMDVDIGSNKEVVFEIKDGIERYTWYIDYTDNDQLKFEYIDSAYAVKTITLIDEPVTAGYDHYVVGLNSEENKVCAWKNLVEYCNTNLTTGIFQSNDYKALRIGSDFDENFNLFDGQIDEFRMFDFILNESQIYTLYTINTIYYEQTEGEEEEDENITGVQSIVIINSTYPSDGENISNMDSIQVINNIEADCELYINNKQVFSIDDTLAFSYNVNNLESPQNEYFVYCDVVLDNTKQYEISDKINFHIEKPSKTIDFYLYNEITGELLVDDDLFIITPCFKTAGLLITNDLQNNQSFYIQKLINGVAYFDLEYTSEYDFCLARGKLNY